MTDSAVKVRVTRRFTASAERVFDAWLDPSRARQFLFTDAAGEVVRVEIDRRVGGTYVIVDRRVEGDVEHTGEYLELDRPRRLVFTLQVPKYSDTVDRVAIDITPLESGCELTLTHELAPAAEEYASQTEAGWIGILSGLSALVD